MPTYQYRCKDCDNELEVVQKFTDAALTDCPVCEGGTLRKVFNAVGVVFKGSGFYRTDSRASSGTPESKTKAADSSSKPAPSGGSETKTSVGSTASAAPASASASSSAAG